MGDNEVERLIVSLIGEDSSYQKMLKEARDSSSKTEEAVKKNAAGIEGIAGSLKALGVATVAYFSIQAVSSFFRDSLRAYGEQEASLDRLTNSLRFNQRDVTQSLASYNQFARELRGVTGQATSTTMAMLAQAEAMQVSGASAERAVRNAATIAATYGGTAQQYIQATIALERGEADALATIIPQLRQIPDPLMRAATAQRILAEQTGNTTSAARTMQGQLNRLSGTWQELLETVGRAIGPFVTPIISGLNSVLSGISSMVDGLISMTGGFFSELSDFSVQAWTEMVEFGRGMLRDIMPVIGAAVGVIEAAVDLASQAWSSAVGIMIDAGTSFFNYLQENFGWLLQYVTPIWEALKDMAIEAMLRAEFALRNFGSIAEFVWTGVKLNFIIFTQEVIHFFSSTVPTTLDWFSRNWRDIFTDVFNYTSTLMSNLTGNIIRIFQNLPAIISGAMNASDLWRPLEEGFRRTAAALVLPERVQGELERSLRSQYNRQAAQMLEAYTEFRNRRRDELNRYGLGWLLPNPPEARRIGENTGQQYNRGLAAGLGKFDIALANSAEARTRIEEYLDRFRPINARGGAAGALPGGLPSNVRASTPAAPSSGAADTRSVWDRMADYLRIIAGRPPVTVTPSNAS